MALQSEVSPPIVGDPNKDTKIDGDTKSEDDEDTSLSSDDDDDVDLEEGEILDSGAEEEKEKDFTSSSLKDALDKNCLQNIEQLINQAKNADDGGSLNRTKVATPRKVNKRQGNYLDHDQAENSSEKNDGWFSRSPKHKKSENRTIDYRNELEAYRGTPPSSPERKKRESRRKKSSKKSKKSSRKAITRKDAKGQRVMRYRKDASRGKPCKYFKEGKCAKGTDCPFSHSVPERFKKKELCKFYLSGHCNKGKNCIYMHGEFPCKFFHTGSVCYAKEDCRFSHKALTEEMKKVLADYLRHVHGDRDHHRDDFHREEDRDHDRGTEGERKRHPSTSPEPPPSQAPPPPKRVCLLGSPPRRIRESEETKRWQEEMKLLQQQNHPSFQIGLMPSDDEMLPNFSKPNFYQETLLNSSPQKHQVGLEGPNNHLGLPQGYSQPIYPHRNFNDRSPPSNFVYEEDYQEPDVPLIKEEPVEDFVWDDPRNMNEIKPNRNMEYNENSQQELDFTSDVKFDETTQFSEMESSVDGPPTLSPNATTALEMKESESEASNQDSLKLPGEKSSDANATNSTQDTPAQPIMIPSHLPRKQRELFMRVQQHNQQKENFSSLDSAESQIKRESEEEEEKNDSKSEESKWYSSEEDDDDSDELLTDVLKKIQQAPPPKPAEAKPAVNLMEMLNKIQQNSLEKSKTVQGSQQSNLLAPFLKGILGSVSPSSPVAAPQTPPMLNELKRRTLLPNPVLPNVPDSLSSKETAAPKVVPQDPRLKNRDPRTLAALANSPNPTKPVSCDRNNVGGNSPILDINSSGPKPLPSVVNEPIKENVPYKLLGIYTRPPNYTPYIHASQSNPKLLNDPRLRKHLQPVPKIEAPIGNGKDHEVKPPPPKDIPPIPELLLKYEKPDSYINIFETNSSSKSSVSPQEIKHPLPMAAQRVCDPRMIRRDSRSNSGSDTPPHLTIVDSKSPPYEEFKSAPVLENALMEPITEKKKLPPVLEKSWTLPILEKTETVTVKIEPLSDSEKNHEPPKLEFSSRASFKKSPSPEREFIAIPKESPSHDGDAPPIVPPLIIKKIKPTPASHLPRAIADPRMAKLHNHLDPRRLRLASSDKSLVERKVQSTPASSSKPISTIEDSSSSDASKPLSGETENIEKEEKPKTTKAAPKKRRLSDKSEEKKRTVHRNRKSGMEYASPLNSFDDTAPDKSASYNSYNQRPKRSMSLRSEKLSTSPILTSVETPESNLHLNFLNDSSNLDCDNSSDGNLKDRFKTIDPTASPFC